MDKRLTFRILGLSGTKEENQIRESCLALLRDVNPEDDAGRDQAGEGGIPGVFERAGGVLDNRRGIFAACAGGLYFI